MRESREVQEIRARYQGQVPLGSDELRRRMLDVTQDIHDFCIENGLKYSLFCGTMLGAQRNGKFIPWDDDMDLAMFREDYNQLCDQFNGWAEKNGKTSRVSSVRTDKNHIYPYAKAYCTETVKLENIFYGNGPVLGVDVDIFPLDDIPKDRPKRRKMAKRRRNLFRVILFPSYNLDGEPEPPGLFKRVAHRLYPGWLRQVLIHRINRVPEIGSSLCSICVAPRRNVLKPYFKSAFAEYIMTPFEDRQFMMAAGYIQLLEKMYKNYLNLPKEEKRVTTHEYDAYNKSPDAD